MKKISKMAGATMLCAGMMFSSAVCASGGDENNAFAEGAYKAKVMESIGHGKRVYFAGPLFNQAEKDFNLAMTKILEEHGYQVFLPQRDGIEAVKLEGKTEEEVVRMIFELDVREVRNADIVFMNLDGRVPDEGACVELGIAYGIGKRCYGIKTDARTAETMFELNPMISGCMIKIFRNFDGEKLKDELMQYLSENEL